MVEKVINPETKEEISYYVDPRLKRFLDSKVKVDLASKDKDYPMLIDGYEGSGKSTFAQQIGKYVDPTLNIDRVCMTADEFKNAVLTAKKNQCVIYDEAVTGMTAGDSISRVGKLLKSLMMQMRQKNLFIIIILPSIFEFNKYAVLSRAKSFFHIYEAGGRRGYFVGFNRRDMRNTYLRGKKNYVYTVKSRFSGRFYGKYTIDEEAYRKKKEATLAMIDQEEETKHRHTKPLGFLINLLKTKYKFTYKAQAEYLKENGVQIDERTLSRIALKFT
jgi:hypothetical protein